ncbi:MAG: TetR/AcrR family transcriptional regulator [Actinobacteria bacterium]|nr:MAG: TetR/AcrR family transcriptional regulator [Actinomycetota bacterium]
MTARPAHRAPGRTAHCGAGEERRPSQRAQPTRRPIGSRGGSSARGEELTELAYRHVLTHGLGGMSLRPLAKAVGSSPRVLLFLFGSKDDLVRALLARARADELEAIDAFRRGDGAADLRTAAAQVWAWLSAPEHRNLLTLWVEAYARSLVEPGGPWADFARQTVEDWLDLLASCQRRDRRRSARAEAERTMVLALLRGAMLDLLATGDLERTTRAVTSQLEVWANLAGGDAARVRPRRPPS